MTERRWARIVDGLLVRPPGDPVALCDAVAAYVGQPIRLLGAPFPPDAPCGLVITTAEAHYVAYDNTTGPLHQRHIVAHELGHLLAGHHAPGPGGRTVDADTAALLMPTIDPTVVRAVLARTPGYGAAAEREAELIAGLLWRRTAAWAGEPTWSVDPAAEGVVDRIRRSLGGG